MSNTKKSRMRAIVVCWILVHTIARCECLRCYKCSGRQECGISFSPNSSSAIQVYSQGDGLFDSCSIIVSPEGLTIRSLMSSYTCQSSSQQFCCKEDLCNSLPSPPLPALTSLKCYISHCLLDEDKCGDDSQIVSLSSATESCLLIQKRSIDQMYKSYKKGCSPGFSAILAGDSTVMEESFCYNSLDCNQQSLSEVVAIRCYTCDSRVTGLAGCSILNISSPNVYDSGSSCRSDACAMIVGLAGRDTLTNTSYPAFTIRTFIGKCVSQPLGVVSYGGATFRGRIDCCYSSYCNTEPLFTNLDLSTTTASKTKSGPPVIVIIVIVAGACIVLAISTGCFVHRLRSRDTYFRCGSFTSDSSHTIPIASDPAASFAPLTEEMQETFETDAP